MVDGGKNVRFKYKIIGMPLMALIALLIIIILSIYVSNKNKILLNEIKTYSFPALELYQNIYLLLIHIQYNFQDAVVKNKQRRIRNAAILWLRRRHFPIDIEMPKPQ